MSDTRPMSAMDRAFLTGDPDAGTLILVRHGQQDFPAPGTSDLAAWLDPPLSAIGARQAVAVGSFLQDERIDAVYASELQRAAVTGREIAAQHGLSVKTEPLIHEVEMFRDLPADGGGPAVALGPEVMREAGEDFVRTRRWDSYPASETGAQLRDRVGGAVDAIMAAHPGQVVVAACHGGVINAVVGRILGLEEEDMFFRPCHASVHRIAFKDDRRVIITLNETAHLVGELYTS